jgi:hypothetical protein
VIIAELPDLPRGIMPNAPPRQPLRTVTDLDRWRIGDPNDLAHLVRTPRALIRSQSITRPIAGISDNQHLRAALRTRRNRKGRGSSLYGHLNLPAAANIPALAQKTRWALLVDSGGSPRRTKNDDFGLTEGEIPSCNRGGNGQAYEALQGIVLAPLSLVVGPFIASEMMQAAIISSGKYK